VVERQRALIACFPTFSSPVGEVTVTSEALVDGELATPDTREVALSGGGDQRELWERWLRERKLGDKLVAVATRLDLQSVQTC
jgi:hypothetical protein